MLTFGIAPLVDFLPIGQIPPFRFFFCTNATRSPIQIHIGVLWRVLVTLWAVCLQRLIFTGVAAPNVNFMRDWLKVGRVAAQAVLAHMVEFKIFWNGANKHFKDDAMDCTRFSIAGADVPIFILPFASTSCAEPNPAIGVASKVCFRSNAFWEVRKLHELTLNPGGCSVNCKVTSSEI